MTKIHNQDIIHKLWLNKKMPVNDVLLEDIGTFAEEYKLQLNSRPPSKGISDSGFDYAVLKFILEYCTSVNWEKKQFLWAKDNYKGDYRIWRKYPTYKVNIMREKIV